MNRDTEYLNVDIEVTARHDLQPLVDALADRVFVLHVGRIKGRHFAGLELAAMTKTADRTIRRLAAIVKSLPRSARGLWNRAQSRDLNIGIQAGCNRDAFRCVVGREAMRAATDIGASIVITVYGSAVGDHTTRNRRPTRPLQRM